ncbi:type 1 glutamine amidotransferase domain-containing protein [Mesorhizobium sp. BR1-1-16]|uniref:type 1 glutamine amidotransferase domain-containing protein n=1 Tax=Mesorhizobium sp. BR1-1-16 TaxID=2876653 RepID=UPI001CCC95DE|nr:type 1 glutamine amidotransferase domain-containing protein [Mesorhizobium sp. BR1-1-16]MBZ9935546.1 type 1 glutamine amidotransferase domain-containing protein [Mesorhizobium sp. BR1-1-16]
MPNILMILTSATKWSQKNGVQKSTGFWGEEFVTPHQIFSEAGADITIATPGGRPSIVDGLSLSPEANNGDTAKVAEVTAYLDQHQDLLKSPKRIEDVDIADYDAVVVPGGHGPMQDLAVNEAVGRVLTAALADSSKVVGALCHGQASFLSAGDAESWPFAGRKLTSFTDEEETMVGLAQNAPWLLEDRLRAGGAEFSSGGAWSSHVVVDGNLVTGQNPQSAHGTAKAILEQIAERA